MAQKTVVQLFDDLDGTSSGTISTVDFGLDGVQYEIDLREDNAAALREALKDYVKAARRTGGRLKRGASTNGSSTSTGEATLIREWAMANGHDVAARGRIPEDIKAAYSEAQKAPAKPKSSSRRATRRKAKA